MSKTMMLITTALSLTTPDALAATSAANVPPTVTVRPADRRLIDTKQSDALAAQSMHFTIQGRTATWAFRFTCTGAHCSFRNSHHRRHPDDPGYVSIATTFAPETNADNAHAVGVIRVTK